MTTLFENSKKFENMYKTIEKKYKEIKLNEENTNINFNNNINLSIQDNPLFIKDKFRFKIGELIMRFLFHYTNNQLYSEYFRGTNLELTYDNQLEFYKFKKSNMNSNKNKFIRLESKLSINGKSYPIIHRKYPQYIYIYIHIQL